MKLGIARIRNLEIPKRDPNMDQVAHLVDFLDGKPEPKRKLPDLDERQTMRALIAVTSREPCFLCQGKPHAVSIFKVPADLGKLGQKLILYTLCAACLADEPASSKAAEDRLTGQIRTENGMSA